MSKLAEINALENGKGIQYLLDTAYRIFHNPIVIHDTNYNLVAYTDVVTDDPLWNELISTGTFGMKTQEFYARECFTENVANADKLAILKSDTLKYDRISGYIFNRDNIKVAIVIIVGCNTPFEEDDPAAFELFADKLTGEIKDDKYFTEFGRAYHEVIINKLLNRVIRDPKIYTPHVQILYDDFTDYLYLAVVDVTHSNIHQNRLAYFKSLLESRFRTFKFAVHSDYVVMIMSSKNKIQSKECFFNGSDAIFEQNNLFVGISSGFENFYELPEYYDKAVTALKKGISDSSGQRIFLYNDILAPPRPISSAAI
ncbi:MAG: hypothetical protein FWC45_03440 [Treponema sp.]|nr:hypothetical protein [Treponema sp.]